MSALSAEPMLQLLCTVLQAEMAVLTLADGNRLVMRKGAVEVCEPGEPAERAGVWAWAPLPVEHELVTVEDTRLDERCGAFHSGALDLILCLPAAPIKPVLRRPLSVKRTWAPRTLAHGFRLIEPACEAGLPRGRCPKRLTEAWFDAVVRRRVQVPGAGRAADVRGRGAALLLRDAAHWRQRAAPRHTVRPPCS